MREGRTRPPARRGRTRVTAAAATMNVANRRELRTATEASSTERHTGTPVPSALRLSSLVAMRCTSATASPTTIPSAMIRPAMTITFSVTSSRTRIRPATASETAIAEVAIGRPPLEQQQGEPREQQESADRERHSDVARGSLHVVGRSEQRRVDLNAAQTGTQGLQRLLDTLRDRDRVRVGELPRRRASVLLRRRGKARRPPEAGGPRARSATSPSRTGSPSTVIALPSTSSIGICARSSASLIGSSCPDPEALIRRVDEPCGAGGRRLEERQGREPQGVAGGVDDLLERDVRFPSRSGSTSTCSCRSRNPQIETLATPSTPRSRGAMFHRASTETSSGVKRSDDSCTASHGSWTNTTAASAAARTLPEARRPLRPPSPAPPGERRGAACRVRRSSRRRKSRQGTRVDLVDEGDAVQEVLLEGNGDQLLHLSRRQPECLRPDLHHRRTELREPVDGVFAELGDADDDRPGGEDHDDPTELQASRRRSCAAWMPFPSGGDASLPLRPRTGAAAPPARRVRDDVDPAVTWALEAASTYRTASRRGNRQERPNTERCETNPIDTVAPSGICGRPIRPFADPTPGDAVDTRGR